MLQNNRNNTKIIPGTLLDEELTRHAVQSNFTGLCGLLSRPNPLNTDQFIIFKFNANSGGAAMWILLYFQQMQFENKALTKCLN